MITCAFCKEPFSGGIITAKKKDSRLYHEPCLVRVENHEKYANLSFIDHSEWALQYLSEEEKQRLLSSPVILVIEHDTGKFDFFGFQKTSEAEVQIANDLENGCMMPNAPHYVVYVNGKKMRYESHVVVTITE